MKKVVSCILIVICIFTLYSYFHTEEIYVVKTFEKTSSELNNNSKEITNVTYYKMSDGTWKTDNHSYKYKLVLKGRLSNSIKDTTYIILSNTKNITFQQAVKASGLSSNTNDYFEIENAVIVGFS